MSKMVLEASRRVFVKFAVVSGNLWTNYSEKPRFPAFFLLSFSIFTSYSIQNSVLASPGSWSYYVNVWDAKD